MGLRAAAALCFERAIAACPSHSEAHNNLGISRKVRLHIPRSVAAVAAVMSSALPPWTDPPAGASEDAA